MIAGRNRLAHIVEQKDTELSELLRRMPTDMLSRAMECQREMRLALEGRAPEDSVTFEGQAMLWAIMSRATMARIADEIIRRADEMEGEHVS